ncbi:MAG: GNAT family N-acetyltransferase [Planctomycetota bacterium]|jgi:RimJ/RimL family protein N-acetyltransferase
MLRGRRVVLRLFTEEDLEELFVLDSDIAARGEYFPIALHTLSDMRKQFRETGWWQEDQGRMVIASGDEEMVGAIVFFRPSPMLAGYEVGYTIFRPEDRGKGYMTEALRIFSAYLFELKPIPRLQLGMFKGNTASRKVAEKCGYQYEGAQRQGNFLRGEYRDRETFSLLRSECQLLSEVLPS